MREKSRTRAILREYSYQAKKRRAQHFLVREDILFRIAAAAEIQPGGTVVEIGAGPGNLTRHLLRFGAQVIAVELEAELVSILQAELSHPNLTVLQEDVLTLDFASLAPESKKLKVVANLPYNISTPVLFKLLDTPARFSELLLLLQKEVADRIIAPPGKKPYGILAVRAQLWAECEQVMEIGPNAFSPRPRVDSALVRLRMRETPAVHLLDFPLFCRVVQAAFGRRRKTLRNSLLALAPAFSPHQITAALAHAGIDSQLRAETLTLEEFAQLANFLAGSR